MNDLIIYTQKELAAMAQTELMSVNTEFFGYVGADGKAGTSKAGLMIAINKWIVKYHGYASDPSDEAQLKLEAIRNLVANYIVKNQDGIKTRAEIKAGVKALIIGE